MRGREDAAFAGRGWLWVSAVREGPKAEERTVCPQESSAGLAERPPRSGGGESASHTYSTVLGKGVIRKQNKGKWGKADKN